MNARSYCVSLLSCVLLCAIACAETGGPRGAGPMQDDMAGGDAAMTLQTGQWQWVEVPGSQCGNGVSTGVGVNPIDDSEDVVLFFQGGGACWDTQSCFVLESAVHIMSGYGEAQFEREVSKNLYIFDRDDETNPFESASYVFVPYCTGDLHNGDKVASYEVIGGKREVHHRGARNVDSYIEALAPMIATKRRLFLIGVSAGGYGVQFHRERFARAFPGLEVHLLADGAPLVDPVGGRFGQMDRAWDFQSPSDCEACADSFSGWLEHARTSAPESRMGLLTYDADLVIALYFAYPLDGSFERAMARMLETHYSPEDQRVAAFVVPGTDHVLLDRAAVMRGGVALRDWVGWWASGDARWGELR